MIMAIQPSRSASPKQGGTTLTPLGVWHHHGAVEGHDTAHLSITRDDPQTTTTGFTASSSHPTSLNRMMAFCRNSDQTSTNLELLEVSEKPV